MHLPVYPGTCQKREPLSLALEATVQSLVCGVLSHSTAAKPEPQMAAGGTVSLGTHRWPAALARTAEVQTAEGGKAPAAQQGPDPHACGGTGAATALEEEWEEIPDKALW